VVRGEEERSSKEARRPAAAVRRDGSSSDVVVRIGSWMLIEVGTRTSARNCRA
jgi:hypothetical protein